MARSSTKKSARRSLLALVVIILALGGLAAGLTKWADGSMNPRLGLDLEGGTELVLQPQLNGTETISEGQVNRAVDIIRQRIDANGVSEAEITTQGGRSIVVAIPGQPTAEQLDALKKPSQLRFRAVYVQALDPNASQANPSGTPTGTSTGTATPSGTATGTGTPKATSTATPSTSATAQNGVVPDALRAATTPVTPTPSATPSGMATTP
ncbi:MAG: protein translocase subunit SecD, partial [Terrabacter sp.]|nr:protein translocase subunit SecD [Terrabacter sp.]